MILTSALQGSAGPQPRNPESVPDPGANSWSGRRFTKAKQMVSPETAKKVAVYYRCLDTISDDIASMPLQQFSRMKINNLNMTYKVDPDARLRNMAYLLEVSPNRFMATPFIFKKTAVLWMLSWGIALIWNPPPPAPRELFILPTSTTQPKFDREGYLWYEVIFPNGEKKFIPAVEVTPIMINSTNGIWGRSILEYAADTIGLRMGMGDTQSAIQGKGLNPSAYIQVNAALDKEGRDKYKEAYSETISGSDNAGNLAVFDNRIVKFEPITMKLTDAQFLESIDHTDLDIANFCKFPAYKLNMGKQAYNSNAQQDLDYLKSTLDPHLVQWEQSARLHWLSENEQKTDYFKFIRESILRTDAKSRAELHEIQIRSGVLQPNEAREIEDRNGYADGDKFWMTSNNTEIGGTPNVPTA